MSKTTKIDEQVHMNRQYGDPRGSRRILAKKPKVSRPEHTAPSNRFAEDAGVPAAMSVGAGDPAKVTNPTDNYAMQKYRSQLKNKMMKRKNPLEEGKMKAHAASMPDTSHDDYEATLAHVVKQAKGIAFGKRYKAGNYTDAHNAISALGKKHGIHNLVNHPEVKSALERSNLEEGRYSRDREYDPHYDPFGDSKRAFRRREHQAEWERERANAAADREEHHVYVNGKVWKKDGHPVAFNGKKHANAAGSAIKKKDPSKDVRIAHHTYTEAHGGVIKEASKEKDHTHAAHFKNAKGEWSGMALITADNDDDAVKQAHQISQNDKWKNFKLDSVERHTPVKEEIEQLDELSVHKMLGYMDAAKKDRDRLNAKWDARKASDREQEKVIAHEYGETRAHNAIEKKTGKKSYNIGKLGRAKYAIKAKLGLGEEIEQIEEGSDLHCPNCGENHGKDRENPKEKTCSSCGHKFKNIHGFSDESDNNDESAAWLKKFNAKNPMKETTTWYPKKGFPKEGEYGYHPNAGLKPQESDSDQDMDVAYKAENDKESRKLPNARVLEVPNKIEKSLSPKMRKKLGLPEPKKIDEMDKSQPSSSRGAEGLATGSKATPITGKKARKDALVSLDQAYAKGRFGRAPRGSKALKGMSDIELVKKLTKEEVEQIDEAIQYHIDNDLSLVENAYRPGSEMFFEMIRFAKKMYSEGNYIPKDSFEKQLLESDIGEKAIYEGREVWLDFPFEEELTEDDKTHGKGIGKPFRSNGGGAVFVRSGSGGVKKVNFSQSGMKKRVNEPARVRSFVARHHCLTNKDKTSASYWACRWPRYFGSGGQRWW